MQRPRATASRDTAEPPFERVPGPETTSTHGELHFSSHGDDGVISEASRRTSSKPCNSALSATAQTTAVGQGKAVGVEKKGDRPVATIKTQEASK